MVGFEDDLDETIADRLQPLLALAEELKRSNLAKLTFTEEEWREAAAVFDRAFDHAPGGLEGIADILRTARNVARRLGAAGEARFGSFKAGRDPDSSIDGRRFHADLAKARSLVARLRGE
jgi:hypothetical protein